VNVAKCAVRRELGLSPVEVVAICRQGVYIIVTGSERYQRLDASVGQLLAIQ
jgi:hypothetical protein